MYKKRILIFNSFFPHKEDRLTAKQKPYLVANVDVNPRLEVVKDLFQVPCSGSSQVTGITVRLERRQGKEKAEKRGRQKEEEEKGSQTLTTWL